MTDIDATLLKITQAHFAQLREKFPKEVIGKLPKAGIKLDYVGHAAVTDRLLSVDPTWTWEPFGVDERGLPAYDKSGGLWIKLTVLGVTRPGYGDGPDPKQRISDAIRNAAMRFGVALDLWSKEELESELRPASAPTSDAAAPSAGPRAGATTPAGSPSSGGESSDSGSEAPESDARGDADTAGNSSTPRARPSTQGATGGVSPDPAPVGDLPTGAGSDPLDTFRAKSLSDRINELPIDVRAKFLAAKKKTGLANSDPAFNEKATALLDQIVAAERASA